MPRSADSPDPDHLPPSARIPRKEPPSRIPWVIWIAVFAIAAVVAGVEYRMVKTAHPKGKPLPILAKVPDFSFTSETGLPVTKASLLGKIWVADFIFTRCGGPCPEMTELMVQFQVATRHVAGGEVHLISVTVDPAYDTPKVLSKYGAKYGTNPDRWSFLTGDPKLVEDFVTKGMLLGLSKNGEGMPVHAQKFVVVDREGYIRSYRDLEPAEVLIPKLIEDIEKLDREHYTPLPERKKKKK